MQVAVKVPNVDGEELDAVMNDLEREIVTMHSLDHKHIVKLVGISDGKWEIPFADPNHFNSFSPLHPLPSSSLSHLARGAYSSGCHGVCSQRKSEVLPAKPTGGCDCG